MDPRRGQNSITFLDNFHFVCSIKDEAALEFYRIYFEKNGLLYFDYLDEIEEKLEKEETLHLVDMVTNNINHENYYYYTYENVVKKVKSDRQLLRTMAKGFLHQMIKEEHSYKKNRAILPYHRVLSLILYTLCSGNIQDLSLEFLSSLGFEE